MSVISITAVVTGAFVLMLILNLTVTQHEDQYVFAPYICQGAWRAAKEATLVGVPDCARQHSLPCTPLLLMT